MGERDMYESKWMAENQRIASPSNITTVAQDLSSYEPVATASSSSLLELDALSMNWRREIPRSNDHLANWFPSPNPMHALKQGQIKSELFLISSKHQLSSQTDEASSQSLESIVNNQLLSSNEAQSQKPSPESSSIASQQKRTVSTISTLKVRKEKLGDRITTLQQLVSPFGKTDTASVLLDTIEYIKSLHDQVNVLFAPYSRTNQWIVEGESDLTSKGLCLVPISTISNAAYDTSMDVWTPTFGSTSVQVINQQSAIPQSY
ncbi:transcription factor bHLH112-like isoform X2 [Dioscorea cayenensis subsp. rotundata]|uniref:Transcription factor bHLH112-like isoform X2 n=1 Tax=Dioscorea cayennensis subsp. rotundata TaxID=55577 RepID=A0AB40B909_DIOCR|nr:transcription factor bHLH112-like isoform X2 [Dioscorea cayenensis subsp. rotundata]